MSVETDADGAAESATMKESWDSARQAGCNSARGTRMLHQCRVAQRDVQRCEMQGVVAAVQWSVEGALVSGRGSFNIGIVSSLTRMSELGGSVTYFSVTELQCNI